MKYYKAIIQLDHTRTQVEHWLGEETSEPISVKLLDTGFGTVLTYKHNTQLKWINVNTPNSTYIAAYCFKVIMEKEITKDEYQNQTIEQRETN